jgi:hypothetical protein
MGQQVHHQNSTGNAFRVDVSSFPDGTYLLRYQSESGDTATVPFCKF